MDDIEFIEAEGRIIVRAPRDADFVAKACGGRRADPKETTGFDGARKYVVTPGCWGGGDFRYDVQVWTPFGQGFAYTGIGRYCRDLAEVADWIAGDLSANR